MDMIYAEATVAELAELLRDHPHVFAACANGAALEWAGQGFDAASAKPWLDVGVQYADHAAWLRDHGFTPRRAAEAIAELVEAIEARGAWAHGNNPVEAALEWLTEGVAAADAAAWLDAGVWSPFAAAQLRSHGVSPQQIADVADPDGVHGRIGQAVSNGDMTPKAAAACVLPESAVAPLGGE